MPILARVLLALTLPSLASAAVPSQGRTHDVVQVDRLQARCDAAADLCPSTELSAWLRAEPAVQAALVWWFEGRGWVSWQDWPAPARRAFLTAYDRRVLGRDAAVPSPPTNLQPLSDTSYPATVIELGEAWELYLSLVLESLATDRTHDVGWSLTDLDTEGLATLLDGRRIFGTLRCLPGLGILGPTDPVPPTCTGLALGLLQSRAVPAPGREVRDWLDANDLIGPTRVDTIARVIGWSSDHMLHYLGSFNAGVSAYYWNYPGGVYVGSVMNGTHPVGDHPAFPGHLAPFGHWTAGCHGTNTFFREVLRVVNVPVRYAIAAGHAVPHFVSEDLYLSHGDDPYNIYTKTADFPPSELLIDQATFDAWFGPGQPASTNIGRRVVQLAAIWLPTRLLDNRCNDLDDGLSDVDGSVFAFLSRHYEMADLVALDFWTAIDAEIADRGGCGAL